MMNYRGVILAFADRLAEGQVLKYRERLQLERAILRVTANRARAGFGWAVESMGREARCEFGRYFESHGVESQADEFSAVDLGFEVMRLLETIANADPYVVNESISRVLNGYSPEVARLPHVLRDFVAES